MPPVKYADIIRRMFLKDELYLFVSLLSVYEAYILKGLWRLNYELKFKKILQRNKKLLV